MDGRSAERLGAGSKKGVTAGFQVFRKDTIRKGGRNRLHAAAVICALLLVSSASVALLLSTGDGDEKNVPAGSEATMQLGVVLVYQHKDTAMACIPDGPFCPAGVHAWNHARGADLVYGSADDCPHCTCYCAPACVAMIVVYRGQVGQFTQQDDIYDNGKSTAGETLGDGVLQTHGVGMFDGTGVPPPEVQTSFIWAIGPPIVHNAANPINAVQLAQYILLGHPVLWLDHNGWPVNQSDSYPDPTYRAEMGHAKVIAGWDDNGTLVNPADDRCLIYDPWPEYTDRSILPINATLGPGDSYDPYWFPLNDILNDPQDVFLVDQYPDIPEFGSVVVPVLSLVAVVALFLRRRTAGRTV